MSSPSNPINVDAESVTDAVEDGLANTTEIEPHVKAVLEALPWGENHTLLFFRRDPSGRSYTLTDWVSKLEKALEMWLRAGNDIKSRQVMAHWHVGPHPVTAKYDPDTNSFDHESVKLWIEEKEKKELADLELAKEPFTFDKKQRTLKFNKRPPAPTPVIDRKQRTLNFHKRSPTPPPDQDTENANKDEEEIEDGEPERKRVKYEVDRAQQLLVIRFS